MFFFCDFSRLLNELNTEYILFGVDDVVYFDLVDFDVIEECFTKFSKAVFGFSLRFSKEMIRDSNDPISETIVAGQTVYGINWTQGRTSITRYPFELCATIYPIALVKRIIGAVPNDNSLIKMLFSPSSDIIKVLGRIISTRSILKSFGYFYSPNTLESWLCRWCQNHSEQLPNFLYFEKLCASAIQVNMVNISTRSKLDGSAKHTVEALNESYKTGYRLDIDLVSKNKSAAAHCGLEHFKLRRN